MEKKICFTVEENLWKKFATKSMRRNETPQDLLEKFVWGYADPNGYQIHLLNEKQRKRGEKYKK